MAKISNFISLFNKLHEELSKLSEENDPTFYEVVDELKEKNPVIYRYYDDLNNIRVLRNLLVHEQTNKQSRLAIPTDDTIELMERIYQQLVFPIRAKDFEKSVITFYENKPLLKVVRHIAQVGYTQYPVFDQNELLGLITYKGIVKWIAATEKDGRVDLNDVMIRDVIPKDKDANNYVVISQTTPLYEIEEHFSKNLRSGRSRVVLLVSKSGKIEKPEDIVGIVTPWDLPEIVNKM